MEGSHEPVAAPDDDILRPPAGRVDWMHRPGERRGMPERAIGDPYVILDVPHDADDATVAAAYRTLARRFHPDLAGDFGTQHMIRINAAYALIRDAAARASFAQRTGDRTFSRSRRPQS